MSYQGHLPDGSSVQRHSAGSCYPFIVYGQETDHGLKYGIIAPCGTPTAPMFNAATACEFADRWAVIYREVQARQAEARAVRAVSVSTMSAADTDGFIMARDYAYSDSSDDFDA